MTDIDPCFACCRLFGCSLDVKLYHLNGSATNDGWWDKKNDLSPMSIKSRAARLFEIICTVIKRKVCNWTHHNLVWVGNEDKRLCMYTHVQYVCLCSYVFVEMCVCALPPLLAVESEPKQCYVALFPQWKPVPGQELQWKFPLIEWRNTRKERRQRKGKERAEEGVNGECKERATERKGVCPQRQQGRKKS